MRYNLLRHTNKSVTALFQTSLGISCDKRGSQGFKFSKCYDCLWLFTLTILGQYIVDL